ncbi:MAG: GNAT family N-acetyltransferase [Planctomycetota bacterium]
MKLQAYRAEAHREACLSLFDGNVGGTFHAEEREGFADFLDALPGPYFVWTEGARIVACGGIAFEDDTRALASVCWTIVDRERQGSGIGRLLIAACVESASASADCEALRLETIPETEGFFSRLGFTTVRTETDGYGPGLHRVEMRMELR